MQKSRDDSRGYHASQDDGDDNDDDDGSRSYSQKKSDACQPVFNACGYRASQDDGDDDDKYIGPQLPKHDDDRYGNGVADVDGSTQIIIFLDLLIGVSVALPGPAQLLQSEPADSTPECMCVGNVCRQRDPRVPFVVANGLCGHDDSCVMSCIDDHLAPAAKRVKCDDGLFDPSGSNLVVPLVPLSISSSAFNDGPCEAPYCDDPFSPCVKRSRIDDCDVHFMPCEAQLSHDLFACSDCPELDSDA